MHLVSKSPKVPDSNYHIVIDNFFTSARLLRLLKENGIAATGTLRANRTENASLIAIDEMKKGSRQIISKYNVTLVRWKDNKVVTVASTLYGKQPMKRASRYIKDKGGRVYIDQPNSISVYDKHMGGVDRLHQNISSYMINLRYKKWWWPLFRFCDDISINNAYQLDRLQPHNQIQKRLFFVGLRREIVKVYY
ncbi:piggyBac transposable element-derived protein 3-like [Lepeophtheirus salmonis]|uniref:piggyBac transposable element-derived protein 3-like n=1 Tax=Lepeophtheirus salmonis TaxID=72036 RepID=UPI001AE6C124|nr:piggyBac transposable element-derived protein 3-like [Lepeophtheirus salmonis]